MRALWLGTPDADNAGAIAANSSPMTCRRRWPIGSCGDVGDMKVSGMVCVRHDLSPSPILAACAEVTRLRQKTNLLCRFKLIWVVQSSAQKYTAFPRTQISGYFHPSRPGKRGVSRSSGTRDGMRWTRQRQARDVVRRADSSVSEHRAQDDGACCVRQNRVVLTPVAGAKLPVTILIQPDRCVIKPAVTEARGIRLRGDHGISRQTIAQGMPDCSGCTCMLVCAFSYTHCTRDRGCEPAPGIPCTLSFGGERTSDANLGRGASRDRETISTVIASAAKQSIVTSHAEGWIASLRSQ
jgi:hypothetical protein